MRGLIFVIVFLLAATLIMPILIITSCDISIPPRDKPVEKQVVESDLNISIYNVDTKENMDMQLEDYIVGVVAAEVPATFEIEALKAQAIAARTYALWKRSLHEEKAHKDHPEASLCTSHLHCQEWLSVEELKDRHGKKWVRDYLPKIEEAVEATRGIIMTYNMEPIEPLYHSTSGGHTENSEDVFASALPYLRSVSSPYEEGSPVLVDHYKVAVRDFVSKLKEKYKDIKINEKKLSSEIDILERSSGGNIKKIKIGSRELTGREVRDLLGLRSADFTVEVRGGDIHFTTRGYGHGVGMSQWGANGMAKKGSTFSEILKHYYQGIRLSIVKSYR